MEIKVGGIVKIERDGKTIAGIIYEAYPGTGARIQAPGYGKIKNVAEEEIQEATVKDLKATADAYVAEVTAGIPEKVKQLQEMLKQAKVAGETAKAQTEEDLKFLTPENIIAREIAEHPDFFDKSGGGDEPGDTEPEDE